MITLLVSKNIDQILAIKWLKEFNYSFLKTSQSGFATETLQQALSTCDLMNEENNSRSEKPSCQGVSYDDGVFTPIYSPLGDIIPRSGSIAYVKPIPGSEFQFFINIRLSLVS